MAVLLTGANGFIGKHILQHLPAAETVICIVRPGAEAKIQPSPGGRKPIVITGNFYEPGLYHHPGLQEPIQTIIHAAAVRGAGQSAENIYRLVNIDGTATLLNFARQKSVEQFIHISTVGVLGTLPAAPPASPDTALRPDNIYHRTKAEAELLLGQTDGITKIILRPTITWGAGDNGFLARLIRMVQSGLFVYPLSPVRLHLLQAEALAGLIGSLVSKRIGKSGTYIIADRESILLEDLVGLISGHFRGRPYPAFHRLSTVLFRLGRGLAALSRMEGLQTSLELISADWYYDISKAVNELYYNPIDTLSALPEAFSEYEAN